MPSSTSNSDARKLARIAVFTAMMLAATHALIAFHLLPRSSGSNQHDENTIAIEQFLYDGGDRKPVVLVGSSLTSNLKDFVMPGKSTNLGFAGGSVMTGLKILNRSGAAPQVVLVEMNHPIIRPVDQEQLGQCTNSAALTIRDALPEFRLEYQPVGIAITLLKNRAKRGGAKEGLQIDPATHDKLVKMTLQADAVPLSPAEVAQYQVAAQGVKKELDELTENGVRAVLMRIPLEAATEKSIRIRQIDSILAKSFPNTQYQWLKAPSSMTWHTTDGDHLDRPSARIFADYVNQKLGSSEF